MSTMMVTFGENRLAVTDPEVQKKIVELVVLQNSVLSASAIKVHDDGKFTKYNKKWTDRDKELLLEFSVEGRKISEIAKILGRTSQAICVAKSKLNLGK